MSPAAQPCQPHKSAVSMSFGYSVNDVLVLIQLSWSTVEGATRACGKHDDLTKEVSSLYDVLAHVYSELSVPDASIGRARSSSKAELQSHLAGCDAQLRIIKAVLDKFNALSAEQKFGKQIWLKVRFANGQDQNLAEIRTSIATYSTAITMSLRLMCLGSRGKVERQLSRQKGSIEGLRESVNLALAHVNASTQQKSLIAAYSNDSKGFWSDLRRELTKDGFSRSSLNSKKDLILSYMKELDSRGVLGYSSTFQKAMEARNETKRQSITPTSFQSSSTLSGGRHSNSSFQSFGYRRDSGYCSSGLEDPVCIRTDSFDPSWSDGRPVTAAAHEQVLYPTPADINVKLDDLCIDSPNTSLPHRTRSQAIPTLVSRTVNDGLVRMQTQQPVVHSPSHRESFTGLAQHRSTNEMEQKIKLEDPRGREFSFPLSQAKTWEVRTSHHILPCQSLIQAGNGKLDQEKLRWY